MAICCRCCGEELPPKKEWDCEHYKERLCCICFIEESDRILMEEV